MRTTSDHTAWMDRDNESLTRLDPGAPRHNESIGRYLHRTRRRLNQDALDYRSNRGRRVVAYVSTGPGEDPRPAFERLDELAARRGWRVRQQIHDDYGPIPPDRRSGWLEARLMCQRAQADGVILVDRHQLTSDPKAYERELRLVARHLCLVELCVPEAAP